MRKMREFEYEELKEATKNFSPSLLIGKGSHGDVFKGTLPKDGDLIVAIKKQSRGLSKLRDNFKLENEAHILSSLPQSPHLIKLLGTSHDSAKTKLLVMEHMPNGTLHQLLFEASPPPTWPKRLEIAVQIAKGLQFLHESEPSIIHRDVKSANILFDSNWNAKLGDFGLAVRYDESSPRADSLSQPAGTIGYLDPDYTMPCKLSTQNDVYSFGIVLLEIFSGTKAVDVSRVPASIAEWAFPLIEDRKMEQICDGRIGLPANMKSAVTHMLHVASLCVSLRGHNRRPSMREVVMEMENCYLERDKFSFWTNILCNFSRRKRRMIPKKKNKIVTTATIVCLAHRQSGHEKFSNGKTMLLREVLADVTLS